jgi:serine/threonine protein kinase
MSRVMEQQNEEAKLVTQSGSLRKEIKFSDLTMIRTLGTGTFGRVKLVTFNDEAFALKCLQKQQIVAFVLQTNIMYEKNMMLESDHPFILQLLNTYKDRDQLYMLLELVQGGELFSRLNQKDGLLPSAQARFYASCVLDAFQYIHSKNICYRDLKPENLLIDSEGYIKVVDFGFAKVVPDRTYTLCGTPEYLAPEIVLGKGHNKGVDYWALGVLIYEMLTGLTPFADYESNDTRVICRNIMQGDLVFPASLRDSKAKDLVRKLLCRDSHQRLGCLKRGAQDIKDHPWFKDMDWAALLEKRLKAPWVPAVTSAVDTSNFDPYDEDEEVDRYVDDGSNWDADF